MSGYRVPPGDDFRPGGGNGRAQHGGLDEWDAGDEPGAIPPRQWLLAVRRRAVIVIFERAYCARGLPKLDPKRAASTSDAEGPFEQIVDDALTVLLEPSEPLNRKNLEIAIDDFLVLSVLAPLLWKKL